MNVLTKSCQKVNPSENLTRPQLQVKEETPVAYISIVVVQFQDSSVYFRISLHKTSLGALIAQLGERRTLDRKVRFDPHSGRGVVSLSKTPHPLCLLLVKPSKL